MADIFLSHDSADRQRVAPIAALLEASGWTVRWNGGDGGDEAASARELAAAGCVIAAWSLDAVDSDTVWAEAGAGLERGALVSVCLDIARPPADFCPTPPISFAGWSGDASSPRAEELIAAVQALLGRARSEPAAAPSGEPVDTPLAGSSAAPSDSGDEQPDSPAPDGPTADAPPPAPAGDDGHWEPAAAPEAAPEPADDRSAWSIDRGADLFAADAPGDAPPDETAPPEPTREPVRDPAPEPPAPEARRPWPFGRGADRFAADDRDDAPPAETAPPEQADDLAPEPAPQARRGWPFGRGADRFDADDLGGAPPGETAPPPGQAPELAPEVAPEPAPPVARRGWPFGRGADRFDADDRDDARADELPAPDLAPEPPVLDRRPPWARGRGADSFDADDRESAYDRDDSGFGTQPAAGDAALADEGDDGWTSTSRVVAEPDALRAPPVLLRQRRGRRGSSRERGQGLRPHLPGLVLGSLLLVSLAAFTMKGTISRWLIPAEEPVTVAEPEAPPPEPTPAPPRQAALPKPQAATPPRTPSPSAASPAPALEAEAEAEAKSMEIEDLLAQVTPSRIEEILVEARRLIRTGDIRAARAMLEVPETETSGVLTFMLAETYDPNVLTASQRRLLADPEHAMHLYRRALELGDARAQQRLELLKAG